jgi:2,4-dienoyl-CoA reductase-like NADH-dependent reductase (Old Yellow Enzyme family)
MKKQDKGTAPKNPQPVFTRRDFIKYSSMITAAMAMPGLLNGCASFKPRQDCLAQIGQTKSHRSDAVFAPARIGSITVRNHILRSATTLGMAEKDGRPKPELINAYVELCEGGVGAIITGGLGVQKNGRLGSNYTYLFHQDDYIPDYRRVTDRVHAHNTPIIAQIAHGGRQTRRAVTGEATVAPSPITDAYYNEETPRELTELEIREVIQNFISTIERTQKAGFDGVQLHAAHGYLLSGFLSPATNKRTDQWGGSTENRFRIIREIFQGARKKVGDYPILIKINAYDHQSDGMRVSESVRIAVMLQEAGCDAIEASCGMGADGFSTIRVPEIPAEAILAFSFRYKDSNPVIKTILPVLAPVLVKRHEPLFNYNVCAAQEIKGQVTIPVIAVGGIRRLPDIEQIIGNGMADFVAMGRPFIIEPDIVNKFKTEGGQASACINCGYCLLAIEQGETRCFYGQLT